MSKVIHRVSRMAFAAMIAALVLVTSAGCASTGSQAAKPKSVNPLVEQARSHGHTPWRYKGIHGRRSMRPQHYNRGEPIFPCKQCDGPTKGGQ